MTRILITGSNSGFGRLAALSFARAGHDVIASMRTVARGDDPRATADAEGLSIDIRRLDVCDAASVAEGIGDPDELDVVVNNAGFEVAGALELVDASRRLGSGSGSGWSSPAASTPASTTTSCRSTAGRTRSTSTVRIASASRRSHCRAMGRHPTRRLLHSVKSSMSFDEFETVMRDTLDWRE